MHKIPLFNLKKQHSSLKRNILLEWEKIIDSCEFTAGKQTELFEKNFAKMSGTKFALGLRSGTASLIIALKAAGITHGDEVLTTPLTFSATADAIHWSGGKPVFIDVDPETGNIDPALLEAKITPNTKAILLVHFYGVPCQVDQIMKIAQRHKLLVIEDASHAHGASFKNKKVGSFGLAGCFSLYPSKTLGSLGNAGVITTNNSSFLKKAEMYAQHGIKGQASKYTHHLIGINELIDNVQAAALNVKLPLLETWIKRKQEIAQLYNQAFAQVGHPGMIFPKNTQPSIYVYSVQVANRSKFQKFMKEQGIDTGVYYPTPLHLQPSQKFLGYSRGDFPKAEKFAKQTVSLPLYPELSDNEVAQVRKSIIKYFS